MSLIFHSNVPTCGRFANTMPGNFYGACADSRLYQRPDH